MCWEAHGCNTKPVQFGGQLHCCILGQKLSFRGRVRNGGKLKVGMGGVNMNGLNMGMLSSGRLGVREAQVE